MNDFRTGKRKKEVQSFTLPSPRKDARLGKIPEKDSITKLKQTENATMNISRNYTTLSEQITEQPVPQLSLVRQRTNVSGQNTKRRSSRKANPVPPSQMLNQLLTGKENMTGNKVKDVESSYKQLEELYNETKEKLTCPQNENLSFIELFKFLVNLYGASKSANNELSSKNNDHVEKITELEQRISENAEFYQKERGKLKNQIDEKDVEIQRLLSKNEKLIKEKQEQLERLKKLEKEIDQKDTISKGVCPECQLKSQRKSCSEQDTTDSMTVALNIIEMMKQPQTPPSMRSNGSLPTNEFRSRLVISDSEIFDSMESPRPLSSRASIKSSALSVSRNSSAKSYRRKSSKQSKTTTTSIKQLDPWMASSEKPSPMPGNSRSNTDISICSSHISFANQSAASLNGHWSRESSDLPSFANSPCSM